MSETVSVGEDRARVLMAERAEAERAAQSAPPETVQAELAEAVGDEVWTEEGHVLAVAGFCDALTVLGGQRCPADVEAAACTMSRAASKKYGGSIPYAAELAAVGAFALIIKFTFWPPQPHKPPEPPPPPPMSERARFDTPEAA